MNRFKQIVTLFICALFFFFSLNFFAVNEVNAPKTPAHSAEASYTILSNQPVNVYAFQEQRSEVSNALKNNDGQGFSFRLPTWIALLGNLGTIVTIILLIYIKECWFIELRLQSYSIAFPFHEFW